MTTADWLSALAQWYPRDRFLIDAAELTLYVFDALDTS